MKSKAGPAKTLFGLRMRIASKKVMRTVRKSLLASLALGILLACTMVASAQNTNANANGRGERRMTPQQRIDRMSTELKLTDDQKTKVSALFKANAEKRKELRDDTSLSREDRREKNQALMKEENKKLKEILTPEQFEKWEKMRPQGRGRGGESGSAPKKSQ
jgi:periplasmic protein CpxP/Spy